MSKARGKKFCSFVLALAVMVSAVLGYAQPVAAASGTVVDLYKSKQEEHAAASAESGISFRVDRSGKVSIALVADHASNLSLILYDKDGKPAPGGSYLVASNNFKENGNRKYTYTYSWNLQTGNYTCGLVFAEDTAFTARIYRNLPKAAISKSKLGITAGFSRKLSVSGVKVKSWASKKKSVATVDKTGKVTGKKAGKTTITATLEDGRKLTCAVTVYANKYKDIKGTLDMVKSGKVVPQPYQAYYDSKGNLKIKMNFLNKTNKNVIALTDFEITVKDKNDKTVGVYGFAYQSFRVPSYSTKTATYTIRKSELGKKADLRSSEIYVVGHYQAKRIR